MAKFCVGVVVLAVCVLPGLGVGQGHAAVTLTAVESGDDVVFSGGGTIDLSGVNYNNSPGTPVGVNPSFGQRRVFVGASPGLSFNFDRYSSVSQPTVFGTGGFRGADLGTGDRFGVMQGGLWVPAGYESGNSLLGSARYVDETLTTLGLTPGTYTWTWGSGITADSLTLSIMAGQALDGDYSGDGFVSQADLDLVLLNWGNSTAPADLNESALPGGGPFDGQISQNELDGVLLNWGDGAPPSVEIPEPASLTILAATLAFTRRRAA